VYVHISLISSPPTYTTMPTILFFFTAPSTPQISTLSLHDALPISRITPRPATSGVKAARARRASFLISTWNSAICSTNSSRASRSEEHTSELQSRENLVCRLLLEKKKKKIKKKNKNTTHD